MNTPEGEAGAPRGSAAELRWPLTGPPLLLTFVLLSVVTHALVFAAPPLSDEPAHLVGSQTLLRGDRLYVDFADNKPPMLYWYYAAAQWMLGAGVTSPRVLLVLVVLPLSAFAASAFYGHDRSGRIAGALYLVTGAAFAAEDALAVNTEVLMLLPAAWAFVLLRRLEPHRHAAAYGVGALIGIAALFKVTALVWVPVASLMFLLEGRGWRAGLTTMMRVASGVAAPLLVALGLLAVQGSAADAIEQTVLDNLAYISAPIGVREAFIRAMRGSLSWSLVTLPLWWAAWVGRPRAPAAARDWLPLMLVACAIPAVCLGYRFFGHYYVQALFPLCLAAGPSAARLTDTRPWSSTTRTAVAFLTLVFIICLVGNAWLFRQTNILEGGRPVFARVAARLAADPCFARATLFVWGSAPMFHVASGLRPATRFVLPKQTLSGYTPGRSADLPPDTAGAASRRDWNRLFADLDRNQATYVLDTAPSRLHSWGRYPLAEFPALLDYVGKHYEQVAIVDRVVVYRRLGCAS